MNRKQFITLLRQNLIEKGFPAEVVDAEMIPVESYFDENNIEDVEVSVEEMSADIAEMINEQSVQSDINEDEELPPIIPEGDVVPEEISVGDEIENALKAIDSGADTAEQEEAKSDGAEDPSSDAPSYEVYDATFEDSTSDNNVEADDSQTDSDVKIFTNSEKSDVPSTETVFDGSEEDYDYVPEKKSKQNKSKPSKESTSAFFEDENGQIKDLSEYEAENGAGYLSEEKINELISDYNSNKTAFWVIFAVALPFIIFLSLTAVALYLGFWLVLALLMIGTVAALIAFVTAGVLVSLVGMVYGVILLIKDVIPAGMFEVGLGLTIGAIVLFFGILVYNFAIRLIPFAMKQLAKLLTFGFKKGKEGFLSLKGVLDRL